MGGRDRTWSEPPAPEGPPGPAHEAVTGLRAPTRAAGAPDPRPVPRAPPAIIQREPAGPRPDEPGRISQAPDRVNPKRCRQGPTAGPRGHAPRGPVQGPPQPSSSGPKPQPSSGPRAAADARGHAPDARGRAAAAVVRIPGPGPRGPEHEGPDANRPRGADRGPGPAGRSATGQDRRDTNPPALGSTADRVATSAAPATSGWWRGPSAARSTARVRGGWPPRAGRRR